MMISDMRDAHINPDIQALRGIAILMVMLQHYRNRLPTAGFYHGLFDWGMFYGGVDLFFVISGFVITKSLMQSGAVGFDLKFTTDHFRAFWIRRAFRLMPAGWLWLAASVALSPLFTAVKASDPLLVLRGAMSALLPLSNIFWWNCVSTAAIGVTCGSPDINGVYWSLSLEEQFYIVLSVSLCFVRLRTFVHAAATAAVCWSLIFHGATIFSFAWLFRPQALVCGVLIAAFSGVRIHPVAPRQRTYRRLRQIVFLASIAGLFFSPVWFPSFSVPLMALCSACAIIAALDGNSWSTGLMGRVLRWIGDRSYSLYLVHLLVFLCLREALFRIGPPGFLDSTKFWVFLVFFPLSFAMAFLVAHISYTIIESPATDFGRALANRILGKTSHSKSRTAESASRRSTLSKLNG